MKINHGVILEEPDVKDWVFGANSQIKYEEVCNDWTPYLPTAERQNINYETSACVTYSFLNCVETQLNQQGAPFNFSDRFLAIASKTDPNKGNTLSRVANTFRLRKSCAEASFPFALPYYTQIPTQLYNEALKTLPNHDVLYESISTDLASLKYHLKQAPIQIIINTGHDWNKPVVEDDGGDPNHGVELLRIDDNDDYLIFDQYAPFEKTLKAGYKIWAALKIVVTKKQDVVWEVYQSGQERGVLGRAATPVGYKQLLEEKKLVDKPTLDITIKKL